jgi:hypothetical protein
MHHTLIFALSRQRQMLVELRGEWVGSFLGIRGSLYYTPAVRHADCTRRFVKVQLGRSQVAWWPQAARQPQAARWAECTYIDVPLGR